MRWSYRIARIAGIDVRVHATFLILLAFLGLNGYGAAGVAGAVGILLLWLALFVIVVMHEYGHALTARRFGIPTRDITLLPIGGVARLERMPREPRQELLIALAGPAVNVVLALLSGVALLALGQEPAFTLRLPAAIAGLTGILQVLFTINVSLVAFNLIPAFPLDGGRVLRALLTLRTKDHARATDQAARLGQLIALGFVFLAFTGRVGLQLAFIALFIWLAAAAEAAAVRQSGGIAGVPTAQVMVTDVRTLAPTDPLSRAVELTLAGFQQDFPVVDPSGAVVGVVTRRDLLRALAERGLQAPVTAAMHKDFQMAAVDEPVETALARLQGCGCQAIPVVRGRELLGVLTLDNVGEYMMVQAALRRGAAGAGGGAA